MCSFAVCERRKAERRRSASVSGSTARRVIGCIEQTAVEVRRLLDQKARWHLSCRVYQFTCNSGVFSLSLSSHSPLTFTSTLKCRWLFPTELQHLLHCPDIPLQQHRENDTFIRAHRPTPSLDTHTSLLHKMARFSRNKSSPSRSTVSPWMTAFYICAILLAPMLFMGMIPSAHAQDTEKADTGVTGPGKSVTERHRARTSRSAIMGR